MVRLAQMECFHPAGEMDDAHLLSLWSAPLIKEAELQAEAANVKLLSNRRFRVVNPQKQHHPPKTTTRFCSGALELISSLHGKFGWRENGSIMRRRQQQLTYTFTNDKEPSVSWLTSNAAQRPHEHLRCLPLDSGHLGNAPSPCSNSI